MFMHTGKAGNDKHQRSGNATIAINSEDAQELHCVSKDEHGTTLQVRSILRKVGDSSTKKQFRDQYCRHAERHILLRRSTGPSLGMISWDPKMIVIETLRCMKM